MFSYLKSRWLLIPTFAIDFSSSNGLQTKKGTLHSLKNLNDYEASLYQVGSIFEKLSFDNAFITYGFGAYLPEERKISNCFPLNGNSKNPQIYGTIADVNSVYKEKLQSITLAGPTYFNPLLKRFLKNVRKVRDFKVYNVLMILSDGFIHDFEDSKETIVDLSEYACSIVIVGLGVEKFNMMEEFDGDDKVLTDRRGRQVRRDIV